MFHRTRLLLVLALVIVASLSLAAESVRIALFTDSHVHDIDSPAEGKVMTNYAERLGSFVEAANAWPADVAIELGDFINGAFVMGPGYGDPTRIPGILELGLASLEGLEAPMHFVLGNHDLYDLSKAEFLTAVGQEEAYYSFDLGGIHFVILDAEFNDPDESDFDHVFMRVKCRIPASEIAWLASDLAETDLPTVVFVHQPFDAEFDANAGGPPVVNNAEIRQLLSDSGVVIAVFQGHDHGNVYMEIDEIHYVTLAAMVDHTQPGPATWSQVSIDLESRVILIEGIGLQDSYELGF
ncbi:metallophosphoesterase family protein [Candidatus Bipolaricaulota bacterium]